MGEQCDYAAVGPMVDSARRFLAEARQAPGVARKLVAISHAVFCLRAAEERLAVIEGQEARRG